MSWYTVISPVSETDQEPAADEVKEATEEETVAEDDDVKDNWFDEDDDDGVKANWDESTDEEPEEGEFDEYFPSCFMHFCIILFSSSWWNVLGVWIVLVLLSSLFFVGLYLGIKSWTFFRIAISWQSPRRHRDIVTIAASAHDASSVLSLLANTKHRTGRDGNTGSTGTVANPIWACTTTSALRYAS